MKFTYWPRKFVKNFLTRGPFVSKFKVKPRPISGKNPLHGRLHFLPPDKDTSCKNAPTLSSRTELSNKFFTFLRGNLSTRPLIKGKMRTNRSAFTHLVRRQPSGQRPRFVQFFLSCVISSLRCLYHCSTKGNNS
jgi:hypothetical protein